MIRRSKLAPLLALFILAATLQACISGCGATPRDRIANAERTFQGLADSVTILAPKIKDDTARAAIVAALEEANAAIAEAHRREAAGEPIDDAYLQDRVWSAINRALRIYAEAEANAQ